MSSVVIANSSGVLSLPALLSNGYSKIVIQNGQDGGTDRGVYLWSNSDSNWGIYMATNSGTSMSGGAPCTGAFGFTAHAIRIRTANSNNQGFIYENSSNTCLFSIRADGAGGGVIGSWGVNTLSPSYNLHVVGSTYLAGTLRINNGDSSKCTYGPNSYGAYLVVGAGLTSNGSLIAQAISTNGNLHLDCSTDASRSMYLNYYNNQASGGGTIQSWGAWSHNNTLSTTGNVGIGITNPSYPLHVIGAIYASGDISALSDQRHKQNITPLSESLATLTQLSGYSYTRSDYRPGEKQIGLIAQEVKAVYPEAVSYDAANDTYSLNYGCLLAPVIQAVKELNVNSLKQNADVQNMQLNIDALAANIVSITTALNDIMKKLNML